MDKFFYGKILSKFGMFSVLQEPKNIRNISLKKFLIQYFLAYSYKSSIKCHLHWLWNNLLFT